MQSDLAFRSSYDPDRHPAGCEKYSCRLSEMSLLHLIKETSVVSFVGAADLYVAFNYIGTNSYEFMVPYLVMAAYLHCDCTC